LRRRLEDGYTMADAGSDWAKLKPEDVALLNRLAARFGITPNQVLQLGVYFAKHPGSMEELVGKIRSRILRSWRTKSRRRPGRD
jgi:hypothetical protein